MNIKGFYFCIGKKNDYYNFILQDLNINKIFILLKCAIGSNKIKVNHDICKYEKIDEKGYSNIDEDMRYVRYYKRNTQLLFDLNCDSKFTDPMFWQRVYEHFTSHKMCNNLKYKFIKLCI